MNNEELNKKMLDDNTCDNINTPFDNIESPTDETASEQPISDSEAVKDDAENTNDHSEKENDDRHIFGNDVNDYLLSEIFDEQPTKKKKSAQKKKNLTPKTDTETKKTFLSEIFDWVEVIVLSASFVLLLFTFVMRLAIVDGPSMENTLHDKEMLIISGLFYTPENNDIIVFNSPNYKEPIVKRIIATENQTVDIDFENWTVTVDGVVLQEDYIKKELVPMRSSDMEFPLTVPEGHVFVMGDNRNDSLDSRNSIIGLVDERYILGDVKLRLFPFNKFGKVD